MCIRILYVFEREKEGRLRIIFIKISINIFNRGNQVTIFYDNYRTNNRREHIYILFLSMGIRNLH